MTEGKGTVWNDRITLPYEPFIGTIGTSPVFTIAFVLITVGYAVWKLARDYRINLDREAASQLAQRYFG